MKSNELEKQIDDFYRALKRPNHDYEELHMWEDSLMVETLKAVVKNDPDAKQMARKILRLEKMNFKKWYG